MKNSDFSKNFASRLRLALNGRSQTTVAKRVGYSHAVISKYLLGDIPDSFTLLIRLAKEFNIDLHKLLTGEDAPGLVQAAHSLSPFILAYFGNMARQIQQFHAELRDLVADKNHSEANDTKIKGIMCELVQLQQYYNDAREVVNKVLAPLSEPVPPNL